MWIIFLSSRIATNLPTINTYHYFPEWNIKKFLLINIWLVKEKSIFNFNIVQLIFSLNPSKDRKYVKSQTTWVSIQLDTFLPHPFPHSCLLPSWRVVWSYRPHLEEKNPIWVNDWSHSPFIRRSPSWGFLGDFLSCKANARRSVHSPRIISLLPLSLATDVTDTTLGASGLWLGTLTGAGGTAILFWNFFWLQPPWLPGQQGFGCSLHGSMDNRTQFNSWNARSKMD